MHFTFLSSAHSRERVRAAFAALALSGIAAFAAGALSQPAHAAQTGLSYDEVTRFVMGNQATPQPGTFAADFKAAVDAGASAAKTPKHGGFFSTITNIGNIAKNAMNLYKYGTASRKYYLGNWERSDDLGAQTATIRKFDQHQVIHLDLANKTYRIEDISAAPMETPPPQPNQNPQGGASPQPGTAVVDITVSSSVLGPKTIDNVPTTGYNVSLKIATTHSTGSCKDSTLQMSMVNYVSSYSEPRISSAAGMLSRPSMPHPEMMAMHPGCNATIKTHQASGVSAPSDHLILWTLMSFAGGAQGNQPSPGGQFGTLVERGNVRTLGAADSSLFSIPADFKKE